MACRFFFYGAMKPGEEITLPATQSHHLASVLRLKKGAPVELVDGKGVVAEATVVESHPSVSVVTVRSVNRLPAHSRVTLAFAIPKGAALDLIVRKCTEVGLLAFQPLITRHSIKPDHWNQERWDKVAHEVIKQCQSPHAPLIYPPQALEEWLAARDPGAILAFCHENERDKKKWPPVTGSSCDLLVGAEGGWSPEETEKIKSHQAIYLSLGANRLRAETAALVALVLTKRELGEL